MAITPTTWNPSDKSAGVTLSNGNLTAATTANNAVRSIFSASTGKWYWETVFTTGGGVTIGIANAAAVLTTVSSNSTNAAVVQNGSMSVNNAAVSGAGFSIPVGTTVCIALDLNGKLIWFRPGAAGTWNNSGTANPATATGGVSISVLGSPLYALVASAITAWTGTTDFGATAFVGTPPSGFTAGFGPDVVAVTQPRAMILA